VIVDTSALIAILKREPEQRPFAELLRSASDSKISAATYLEASIVVDSARDPIVSRTLDDLIESARITIEPVTAEQARIARQAYRDYGKGSGHPAGLNFGDCFSYALARSKREPLLFKGNDFIHTDLRPAVLVSSTAPPKVSP
jgi:ribonuclease VapC